MNNRIAIYGFTEEQLSLFTEHVPDGYVFKKCDDAVGLIGAHCIPMTTMVTKVKIALLLPPALLRKNWWIMLCIAMEQ